MKRIKVWTLGLTMVLSGALLAADEKKPEPSKDQYAELFTFPAKITLDDTQKEKLAELRKKYEPSLVQLDKQVSKDVNWQQYRLRVIREITRKKNALLTETQKEAIKVIVPTFVQEKALGDGKTWDLEQLEKIFVVQLRSYDPDEQVVSFTVLSKEKWTPTQQQSDATSWGNGGVRAIFYNKNEGEIVQLNSQGNYADITRVPAKLTEKETEDGLVRYQIKIDLGGLQWDSIKDAASAKLVYPVPK